MAVIPTMFRKRKERAIASFDYADILTGTAYQHFYMGKVDAGDSDTYVLKGYTFFSEDENATFSTSTSGLKLDYDFDADVSIPQILEGDVFVSLLYGITTNTTPAPGVYAIVKIRKYDGSTETELGSATLDTYSDTTAGYKRATGSVAVPRTKFAVGDIIRVTVEVYAVGSAGGGTGILYFDPKNSNPPSGESSIAECHIPFRIVL